MNKIILIGNLVKEPELRYIQDFKVVNNTIAVKSIFKNKNGEYDTEFIDVQFSGPKAEFVSKYAYKGSKMMIEGYLRSRVYKSEKYNCEMKAWDVKVENVEMLDGGKNAPTQEPKEQNTTRSDLKGALSKLDNNQENELKKYFSGENISDEDLPF